MKRLFYPPPIREFLVVFLLLFVGNLSVFGEGSKDFWDYSGFRLFYLIADASPEITNEQQLKVYAAEGEFINVGSSHIGIAEGFINVYRPDGTIHTTFDGSTGTAIISNDVEELAGPTGAGSTNGAGYVPGVIQVEAGQAGIWTVVLDYPEALQGSGAFLNLSNGEVWTREVNQPTNGRVALAWDITVSQNAAGNMGGNLLEGRVYSNEYISIVSSSDEVINATSPTFYILTRPGFQYQIDFDRADPWGFPLFSNSMGIVTGDRNATYQSFGQANYTRSADPSSWIATDNYLYHPQAEDNGLLWNNKIFFNIPDANMPAEATVTDVINGNNTHTTWLYNAVADDNVGENTFGFNGINPEGGMEAARMQVGEGGNFAYASQVGGIATLQLDLNNNGSFDDAIDRVIAAEAVLGDNNAIFWDGIDGEGNAIPANPNFEFTYDLTVRGGEVHLLMDDVENNLGGVTFTRINGVNSPAADFFYDHSQVGGAVSGGGTAGNALSTTTPFTYENNFGNARLLDSWAFVEANNFGAGAIAIAIVQDLNAVELSGIDTDGDGVDDDIDLDDDNDGILDVDEIREARAGTNGDSDQDGVLDRFDLDSDNDGIKDVIESDNPDPDGDGRIGNGAVTVNADGIVISDADGTAIVYNPDRIDPDGPGTPDYLDLDSDNNGIFDVAEAGLPDPDNDGIVGMSPVMVDVNGCVILATDPVDPPVITGVDTDGDGVDDGIDLDDDNDGILDADEMRVADNGGDSDLDGVPDHLDRDSDNDGLKDAIENDNPDPDGDGIIGMGVPTVDADGIVISDAAGNTIVYNPDFVDPDGPGRPDHIDIDSDNNGIFDVVEAGFPDPDNDGRFGMSPVQVDAFGCVVRDVVIADRDGDGIADDVDLDNDNDGISDAVEIASASSANGDSDGDGILDQFDLDSDNDGISDLIEAGHGQTDANGDGIIDGVPADFGLNGLYNPLATSADGLDAEINYITVDWDGDNVPDHLDLDSDNDGIYDVVEVSLGGSDTNNDGRIDSAVNANGITTLASIVDTDGDGVGDWHDWDTDNDGIHDVVENLNADADGDGIIGTGTPTVNANGVVISDATGAGITYNPTIVNTDNTGAADFRDLDSDGDGILDVAEAGLPDGDGNGILGTGTPTINVFGVPSALDANGNTVTSISNPIDADGNGTPDFQEIAVVEVCTAANTPVLGAISAGDLCAGSSAVVSVSGATNFAGPANFTWTGPNGVVESGRIENVNSVYQITVTDVGTYSLSVTTDDGCTSAPVSAAVNPITGPTAVIGGTSGAICSTDNVSLTATDLGPGTTYEWFRDGMSLGSTGTPAFNAGSAAGSYTVVATQNGCPGAPSAASVVTISTPPTVGLGGTTGNVCSGETIQITTSPLVAGTTYNWFLNGELITTTGDPSLTISGATGATAANNGNYAVAVTQNGCIGSLSTASAISVTTGPNATIGGTSGEICSGTNIQLTASAQAAGTTYEWFQDNVLVGTTNVPLLDLGAATTASTGGYTVVASQNGCAGTPSGISSINVDETILIRPDITVDNPLSCEGDNVSITATEVPGDVTYIWYLNGVEFTRQPGSVFMIEGVTIANTGEYALEVMQDGCTSVRSNSVNIEVVPSNITTTITTDSTSICTGESTTLTATNAGEGYSYEWSLNGDSVTTTTMPSLVISNATVADAGDYTVIPTRATCPGTVSNTVAIDVTDEIVAGTVLIGTDAQASVCPGEGVTFVLDGAGSAANYDWYLNGNFITSTTEPTLTIDSVSTADVGDYTVILSDGACFSEESIAATVSLNEVGAVPVITSDVTTICPGEMVTLTATGGDAGATYEWFNGATSLGTTDVPTFVVTGEGSYTVTTTGSACGGGTSNAIEVVLNPSSKETAVIVDLPSLNCGETTATIEAVAPIEAGVVGTWTSNDPNVVFANPNSPITDVSGLGSGSILTWTLNDGVCGDFSSDSFTANIAQGVATATDDAFTVAFNNSLNANITDNDNVEGQSTVTLITNPANGTATISGGMVQYTPNANFFGTDMLEYEICNATCPGMVCDRAIVSITVEDNPECFVPDAITPNGDGFNDVFRIPCAATNNLGMKIFNRWGDKVFETDRYNNDWTGTHDGELLPPGPYYYVLDDGSNDMKTGCISISR